MRQTQRTPQAAKRAKEQGYKPPIPPTRVSLVPKDETKADAFIRLANYRAKKAISYIRALGRLGSPSYDRDSDQIAKLEATLADEVKEMGVKLRHGHEDKVGDIL